MLFLSQNSSVRGQKVAPVFSVSQSSQYISKVSVSLFQRTQENFLAP
jgi:hypothetical protein